MQANHRLTDLLVALRSPCGFGGLRCTPTFSLPIRNNAYCNGGVGVGGIGGVCMHHKVEAERRLCLFSSSLRCNPSLSSFPSSRGYCGGPGVWRGLGCIGGGCKSFTSSSTVGCPSSSNSSSPLFDRTILLHPSASSSVLQNRSVSFRASSFSVGDGLGVSSSISCSSPIGFVSLHRQSSPSSSSSSSLSALSSLSRKSGGGGGLLLGGVLGGVGLSVDNRVVVSTRLSCMYENKRYKMVKSSAYRRRSRASPTGQSQKAHIGVCRLSAEYVSPGCILVRQRRYIAWGFESKRRRRHKKIYPGENVGVAKNSSLVSLVYGRVKYTHDVSRDVLLCNVLPEEREELLRTDLWRYRTEHVQSKEENRNVCFLRRKAVYSFPKTLVNPPSKPLPRPKFLSRFDQWQNPTLPDAPSICQNK